MAYKLSVLESPHSETMCHTLKRGVGGIAKDEGTVAGSGSGDLLGNSNGAKRTGPVAAKGDPAGITGCPRGYPADSPDDVNNVSTAGMKSGTASKHIVYASKHISNENK